ncbi:MAG: hypothetical protein AAGJ84_14495 [Pseudomonadota bacterium]
MAAALPLIGHADAQARFLKARASGRLHHGWIIEGPSGIGKSRFASRLAGLILGASSVDADASDPVLQKIMSGAHPDLKWVARAPNESGKLRQDITVDQIRDLNRFFALRPALAGWRIGVIDALDDANLSGLNALLKTLEEPPKHALLFLINHGTQRLLPTIRSRCQTLRLYPLSAEDTADVLRQHSESADALVPLSHGRPGYGLGLQDTGGLAALNAADALLKQIRRAPPAIVADALNAAAKDEGAIAAFGDHLLSWTADRAKDEPDFAEIWFQLHAVRSEAAELALTPLQTASKLYAVLQDGVKSVAPST